MSQQHPDTIRREEESRLAHVEARLQTAIDEADHRIDHYRHDLAEQKTYMAENRDEMDHIEKIASRASIEQTLDTADAVLAARNRMRKMLRSPYFGRIDFSREDEEQGRSIYIGVHHFHDDAQRETLVHDWRAPISSMFYDHETGPADYQAPEGRVRGSIDTKRQFRIRDGAIELLIESEVNIMDDVLQDELGRASDDAMRNIVATIQRDQNAIIRNEETPVLVIQGVAGSGKTSIALHRIAFLLYRFKDEIASSDILIISPNRVFADYISEVLPELGEESVSEIDMGTLADSLLEGQYRFQSFFEQTTALLEKDDEETRARMRHKASPDFLARLDDYVGHVERQRFRAEDLWVSGRLVPAWLLAELYLKHRGKPVTERVRLVLRETEQRIGIQYHYDLTPEDRKALREGIRGMVNESSLRETYRGFFDWIGRPELFRLASRGRLEYADVFPMIYLKMCLFGIDSRWRKVKHLLIDEMQDYTPVQYAVIARLFRCNKTILGDANQSVNPYSASTSEEIRRVFREATCMTLNKSYRSSYQITRFAQRILPDPDLVAIERHGPEPEVLAAKSRPAELALIRERIEAFRDSEHNTLALICRTQKQAERLHRDLARSFEETDPAVRLQLLNEHSQSFGHGIIVCTAYMAKGLEFDEVVVAGADSTGYRNRMDQHLLYVACTRARHRLTLTYQGTPTALIDPPRDAAADA